MASAPPWRVAPCSPEALCTPHLLPLRLTGNTVGLQDSLIGTVSARALAALPAEFGRFSQACSRGTHAVPRARSCHSGKEASRWPPQWPGEAWKRRVPAPRENQPAQARRCRRRRWPSRSPRGRGGPRQAASQLAPSPTATILTRRRSALDCGGWAPTLPRAVAPTGRAGVGAATLPLGVGLVAPTRNPVLLSEGKWRRRWPGPPCRARGWTSAWRRCSSTTPTSAASWTWPARWRSTPSGTAPTSGYVRPPLPAPSAGRGGGGGGARRGPAHTAGAGRRGGRRGGPSPPLCAAGGECPAWRRCEGWCEGLPRPGRVSWGAPCPHQAG